MIVIFVSLLMIFCLWLAVKVSIDFTDRTPKRERIKIKYPMVYKISKPSDIESGTIGGGW